MPKYSIKTLLILMSIFALAALLYTQFAPKARKFEVVRKLKLDAKAGLPPACVHWFVNPHDRIVCALILTGDHPLVLLPHIDGGFFIESTRIEVPTDRKVYIINSSFELVQSSLELQDLIVAPKNYSAWGTNISNELNDNKW